MFWPSSKRSPICTKLFFINFWIWLSTQSTTKAQITKEPLPRFSVLMHIFVSHNFVKKSNVLWQLTRVILRSYNGESQTLTLETEAETEIKQILSKKCLTGNIIFTNISGGMIEYRAIASLFLRYCIRTSGKEGSPREASPSFISSNIGSPMLTVLFIAHLIFSGTIFLDTSALWKPFLLSSS